MNPRFLSAWALLLIGLLVACTNPFKAGQMSDASVTAFHQKLDQEQYHALYAASTREFQSASSEKDVTELFTAIHRKLGNVVSANRTNTFVNATTNGSFVRTNYQTKFAQGQGEESFTWLANGEQLTLVAYHIESRELMVK
jgi:Protein of unknown function (DUF4019)